jgi:hypothetical protein
MSIESVFAVVTPIAGVVTVADDNGWSVDNLDGTDVPDDLPGLRGDAGLLLDIAAGRRNPVTALRGKGVRINHLHRLLKLAPIAKENPGLPGGSILRRSTPLIAALGR